MYPKDNIFDLYREIGYQLPFKAKRLAVDPKCLGKQLSDFENLKGKVFVIEDIIQKGRNKYAYGYVLIDGIRQEDDYVTKNHNKPAGTIPNAGCGGWILVAK